MRGEELLASSFFSYSRKAAVVVFARPVWCRCLPVAVGAVIVCLFRV